ncbi:MAG: AAA family ATPase [Nanoarchaeota archaeon]|nr:AAA family ATPase [Nanoarchaeota archaeon]
MTIKDTLDKLEQGTYKNSKPIILGGIPFSARDVLVKAPLLAKLNMFYLGDRGEGKTQLAHDINSYFGENVCYAEGRPDFEPSELFRQLNAQTLGKVLRGEASQEEVAKIEELTKNVNRNLFYIDELNRCPPITQNYFFNLMDGKIIFHGKILPLGNKGYSVGFASANSGNAYTSTFDMDAALLDRMHMTLDITHPDFFTTAEDVFDIFSGDKKDPRASMPANEGEGLTHKILEMHEEFKKRPASPILCLMAPYFNIGLDYARNTSKHSKRALKKLWPNIQGLDQATDEDKMYPLSKRAILGAIALTSGLEMIAEETGKMPAKTNKEKASTELELFLDALKLTIPYSGVISQNYIESRCNGDNYTAFENLFGENSSRRREIREKFPKIYDAFLLALYGKTNTSLLDDISSGEGEWKPVRDAVSYYANSADKEISNEKIIEQAKE